MSRRNGRYLSRAQEEALAFVPEPQPASIHPQDRMPEWYVRMARKATIVNLEKRGLTEHAYRDSPEGWYAKLTERGWKIRLRIIEEGLSLP